MILALFFTRGVSLETWVDTGLFDREKLIYEEHLKQGHLERVFWITYGSNDREIAQRLQFEKRLHTAIEVVPMPKVFDFKRGSFVYSLMIPFLHSKVLRRSDILKTNQMNGSWAAVLAKLLYKKHLVVRTGFTKSLNLKRELQHKQNKPLHFNLKITYYQLIERIAYRFCDVAVVTSTQDKEYLCGKYHLDRNNVQIIRNYVDTKHFRPLDMPRYPNRLLFVGRLTEAKNLFNLIEAVSQTGLILDIYGKGELQKELELHALKLGGKVNFMGVVSNSEMPNVLNRYRYFILPSLYEGMPKALVEAMACGLVCIGTDVNGINELIQDGVDGLLAENTDANTIAKTIQRALSSDLNYLSRNAVSKINNYFSLEKAVAKESDIIEQLKRSLLEL